MIAFSSIDDDIKSSSFPTVVAPPAYVFITGRDPSELLFFLKQLHVSLTLFTNSTVCKTSTLFITLINTQNWALPGALQYTPLPFRQILGLG
jgi:hypothetical protein